MESALNNEQDSGDTTALDVNLSESQLLTLLKQPIQKSRGYWEGEFTGGLKKVREDNQNLYLPNHWRGQDVYDYQEMSTYQDNRIFTSIETVKSTVNARVPQLQVMPGNDSPVALMAAQDMQKAGEAYVEKYDVLDLFTLATHGLQVKREGYIKLRWDPAKGEHGEIVCEYLQPDEVITDQDAKMGQIPRFQVHVIRNHTIEEILAQLPQAQQKIYELAGFTRTNKKGDLVAYKTQLGKKMTIYEVWFRYLEDGKMKSGVCWTDENIQNILDKAPNPNWNYEEDESYLGNLLPEAAPPIIPINYLNDGSSYVDQTSLLEQAAPLQRILDKRGFQIMENADQAGGGLVFNTKMISKGDIAKLVGSPDERIGVKGNVNEAVVRVQPPPLPAYVIQDKADARNEIDNIFATHAPLRGETSGNATLGQDVMQQRGDLTRMDDVARSVERMARNFYRYLFQMMKVYYTEDHWFVLRGEGAQFDYVIMRADMIHDGADIRVGAGSMRAPDKITQQKQVEVLITKGMIDPLTVYEVMQGGNLPSPQKMLERYMLFKTDPLAYMGKTKEDDISREAVQDIQVLNRGEMPKLRDEYPPTYLNFMNKYMMGGEFTGQEMPIQIMYTQHLRIVQQIMSQQLAKLMSQLPSQDELDSSNQRAAEQQQLSSQINPPLPGESAPGAPGGKPGGAAKPAGPAGLAERMAASTANA
jgi:hypothetical protein